VSHSSSPAGIAETGAPSERKSTTDPGPKVLTTILRRIFPRIFSAISALPLTGRTQTFCHAEHAPWFHTTHIVHCGPGISPFSSHGF